MGLWWVKVQYKGGSIVKELQSAFLSRNDVSVPWLLLAYYIRLWISGWSAPNSYLMLSHWTIHDILNAQILWGYIKVAQSRYSYLQLRQVWMPYFSLQSCVIPYFSRFAILFSFLLPHFSYCLCSKAFTCCIFRHRVLKFNFGSRLEVITRCGSKLYQKCML